MNAALAKLPGPRILVVEDEAMVAMMLEDMLLDLGCEVVGPAASLKTGLALARQGGLDAAVLDVNLAGEKAFAIADVLAEQGVPFVYATGYGRAGLRGEDEQRLVLQKPYTLQELARNLHAAGILAEGPVNDGPPKAANNP